MEYFMGYVIGGVLLLVVILYGIIPNLKCIKNKFGGHPCDEHEQFPGT